jgi:hypothetical protein
VSLEGGSRLMNSFGVVFFTLPLPLSFSHNRPSIYLPNKSIRSINLPGLIRVNGMARLRLLWIFHFSLCLFLFFPLICVICHLYVSIASELGNGFLCLLNSLYHHFFLGLLLHLFPFYLFFHFQPANACFLCRWNEFSHSSAHPLSLSRSVIPVEE